MTRLRRASSWSGLRATTIWMVEQLGFAMIPFGRLAAASMLTSGTMSGHSGSFRNAEELSTTSAPLLAAIGDHSRDVPPPAEKSATSTPSEDLRCDLDHGVRGPVERHGLAGASSRCDGHQLGYRKRALLEHAQHLRAYHSGGSHHRDLESLSHGATAINRGRGRGKQGRKRVLRGASRNCCKTPDEVR